MKCAKIAKKLWSEALLSHLNGGDENKEHANEYNFWHKRRYHTHSDVVFGRISWILLSSSDFRAE